MKAEELYPPFPYISHLDFHTIRIEWFECLEELAADGMDCAMEVTLKANDKSRWEQIYIGTGTCYVYTQLEPNTEYELRLRIKYEKEYGPYGSVEVFETQKEPNTSFDLHRAIKFEDIDLIKNLLSNGPDKIELTDQMDYTPLMAAVSRNNKIIINILMNSGADVNTSNKLGKTALMLAANKGFVDIVDILIKRGASLEAKDIHGMSALFYAVDGEFSNVVRALVRAGAQIDDSEADNNYTPLIRLACLANNGNAKVGATLIECGANINHQDKFGQTPLIHCAFHRNHADLAKVLLTHGADITIQNKKHNTALDIAKSLENMNFVQTIDNYKKKMATSKRTLNAH